jgi:DNA-binding XRE family transcriptional regulator
LKEGKNGRSTLFLNSVEIMAIVYWSEMKRKALLKIFGKNVRDARRTQGLTQEELAEKCDLDFRQIGFIERGENNPTLLTIHKICNGLKSAVHHLFRQIK